MTLVLGLKGVQHSAKNNSATDEFFATPIILKLPDYTDRENLDEILNTLAQEWLNDEERKKEVLKMVEKRPNVDYFISNIMADGVVYSCDDPLYSNIFDSIGVVLRS